MAYNIFNQLRLDKKLCDVLITVDGAEFHAHKIIMYGYSAYFRALLTNDCYPPDQHVYSIPDVSAHIMELIMQHAYVQHVAITEENVRQLLIAADDLKVTDLVNKCCEFLEAHLRLETCIDIWRLTYSRSLEKLKQQAIQVILCNFGEILHISDEFLDLTVEQLSEIITNDYLNVKHEDVVFDSILKWISHSLQERKAQIGLLVSKVRMQLLSRNYLIDKVLSNALVRNDNVAMSIIYRVLMCMRGFGWAKCLSPELRRPRLPSVVLLAIGGFSICLESSIEAYNFQTNSWIRVIHRDGTPRQNHGTVSLNGFVYCIGGHDGKKFLNSLSRFDPDSRTWTEMSPMHFCRCYFGVCVLDGQIYAVGGYDGRRSLNTVERYNPETDQWHIIAPMREQRTDARAAVLNGHVYVCGGASQGVHLSTSEFYSHQLGQWTPIPKMSSRRSGLGVTAYSGELYAVGGMDDSGPLSSAEVYNPQTNSWRNIPDMITDRCNFGIEVMNDRLFVVGGYKHNENIQSATCFVECYDKKTAEWTSVKHMGISRSGLSCCLLSGLPNMANYSTSQDDFDSIRF